MTERAKSEAKGKSNFFYGLVRKAKEMLSFSKNSHVKTYKEVNEAKKPTSDDEQGFNDALKTAAMFELLFPYNDGISIGFVPLIPPDQPTEVSDVKGDDAGIEVSGDAGCSGDGGGFGE